MVEPTAAWQRPSWMRQWPKSAPRPTGPWTVANGTTFGLLDPERGIVTSIDPATDRRLPGLAPALAAGDRIVAYRHRRRAVTRSAEAYTKVVRPEHAAAVIARHDLLQGVDGLRAPHVLAAHDDGRVRIEAVHGERLHDRLRSGAAVPIREIVGALAALHARPVGAGVLPAARVDDPMRWVGIVARIAPALAEPLETVARQLPPVDPAGSALLHTDLHDKNIILTTAHVALVDLDALAVGAPEIDVMNLVAHLELRALQAGQGAEAGRGLRQRVLANYCDMRPFDGALAAAIERHTWFRLACLYLCRTPDHRLVDALLRRADPAAAGQAACSTRSPVRSTEKEPRHHETNHRRAHLHPRRRLWQ